MNVNQRIALGSLRSVTPDHAITRVASNGLSVRLKCSCGWVWGTSTRNALARSMQVYGAEIRHLKDQHK